MRRSAALSAVMIGLFVGSLALAGYLKVEAETEALPEMADDASVRQPFREVDLGGTRLHVPAGWVQTEETNNEGWLDQTGGYLIFIDPERPASRRIRLAYIDQPDGTRVPDVFQKFLGDKINYFKPFEENIRRYRGNTHSATTVSKVFPIEVRMEGRVIPGRAQIDFAVLHRNNSDGERFWLIYLSDVIPPAPEGEELKRMNDFIFQTAVRHARPKAPSSVPEAIGP
ncbi:hypothetical protein Pan265_19970 [Mucisphaera calidilacus]|uniref:Uncharacterized protein n=2 Tax=Mucisphaera calidilacus TaxID=2527982 RepID=A0A518BYU9_9BACT|nr:hypothetical protein Pan265_19970 [Mucisphaera calidilacus]